MSAATPMPRKKLEELLETIYTERERGHDDAERILAHVSEEHAPERARGDFSELATLGLVRVEGERVLLSEEGEREARLVVRRHRLAERLFRDLLDLSEGEMESQACECEHILSPDATDAVCTLLGHPPTCPHGKAIPAGPCCGRLTRSVGSLVSSLDQLELGARARIVFIAPKFHDRMDRLAALGIAPGCEVHLHQRAPAYVLEAGETTVALDPEIAKEIFVRRTTTNGS